MADAPLVNGTTINGTHEVLTKLVNADDSADSPAIDSPTTPRDDTVSTSVKIDVHSIDQEESDVRHEPIPIKVDALDAASTIPQVATPIDPASIPVEPPKGTPPPPNGDLLEDVKMAEASPSPQVSDVDMPDADVSPPNHVAASPLVDAAASAPALPLMPSSTPAIDSVAASSPYSTVSPNDDDVQPPPAKRARKHSDADQASLANTATPPPASVSPAPMPEPSPAPNGSAEAPEPTSSQPGPSNFSAAQHRFCLSTIRSLKKLKPAAPFLKPVDPIALNIPHYPSIIKQPMDFQTIERKLQSSNPSKPDPNPQNPRYLNADQFVADVRLIFSNCLTFNGDSHAVTAMSRQVEEVFDKQLKNMPPAEVVKPPVVKKPVTPPPPPPPAKKARRPSNLPTIRRTEEPSGRPKREIHPPPPKDLPYADHPKKIRKAKVPKDNGVAEQLRYCDKILKDLHKKQHYTIAQPFYDPVDWVKLQIPAYPKIIKHPMDLATMRKKLDAGEYATAEKFQQDFKLMIRNCFTFNPAGTPVNLAGQELQRLFDEKWKGLPPLPSLSDDEDEEEEEFSEDDRSRAISALESQIESMHRQLVGMKQQSMAKKATVKKEKKPKAEKVQPVASSSKSTPKSNGKVPTNRKKTMKKPVTDDDVLSFEQKKELSDTIGKLDGVKLERVIQIIHEGVPEIRDSTEEIELEIDTLPASVLTKLYNFVIRPTRAPPTKRARTGKGTGTGGLKRKSMDEDIEAEKIRVLEERMALFERGGAAVSHAQAAGRGEESDHSSDSSSDDSSGSDSE